ncbi:galactosyltransferase-related protein [Reyranella humidisoli]
MKAAVIGGRFVTVRKVKDPTSRRHQPADFSYVVEFPDQPVRVTSLRRYSDGARSGPGLIMLRREDFIRVGGMSSDLYGWGWEDIDLLVRLQKAGLRRRTIGQVRHLRSSVITSTALIKRQLSERRNIMRCIKRYQTGNSQGSISTDMANVRDRKIHVAAA